MYNYIYIHVSDNYSSFTIHPSSLGLEFAVQGKPSDAHCPDGGGKSGYSTSRALDALDARKFAVEKPAWHGTFW